MFEGIIDIVKISSPDIELEKTVLPEAGVEPLNVNYTYREENTGDETLGELIMGPNTLDPAQVEEETLDVYNLLNGTYINIANATGYTLGGFNVTDHDDATVKVSILVGGEIIPEITAQLRRNLTVIAATLKALLALLARCQS